MGRLKRLALWGAAGLMAVTAVAVGEPDPAWATSPTDAAREAGVSGAEGPSGPAARPPGKADPRPYGLSGLLLASSHCQHGQWSNGRCRACPVGQVWITGTGCVVATNPRQCSSGNTYFSTYRGCRPTTCASGRTSTGYCRPACSAGQSYFSAYGGCRPTTCANGRTSTGTCRTCPAGQTYLSAYSGCRPTTCANGRRSNGTCRSCADPTHMRRDGACLPKLVPAATDPPCPTGQLYYSSYGGCRPTTCANGRTSTGTCRVCPAGQTQRPAFGTACVPANCTYGYTGTGTCEAASPNHRYPALKCSTYSADATAREYLDVYSDKLDRATCPPRELFLASTGTEDWPTWGFQGSIADDYGKVVVEKSGNCSGGLSDTGEWWDFRVPCKAHDHCFDLRRAGLTGTVTDGDCDDLLKSLMDADCEDEDRPREDMHRCSILSGSIRFIQRFVNQGPNPGPVKIVNVKIGRAHV